MKILPSIWIAVIVLILVIVLFFSSNYFLNFLKPGNADPEILLEAFPTSEASFSVGGKNKEWKMQLFQGFLSGFETVDGMTLMKIDYFLPDNISLATAKVLINISEKEIPTKHMYKSSEESNLILREQFIDSVSIYPDLAEQQQKQVMSVEDFKKFFETGAGMSLLLFTEFPSPSYTTEEFCIQNGTYQCVVTDMVRKFSPDYHEFWELKSSYKGILVPYKMYMEIQKK